MDEIYSERFWRLFDDLDRSLDPTGPDELYEVAAPFLGPGVRVLDVGCRDARHLIALVQRYRAVGVGFDPVTWHLDRARAAVQAAGLGEAISIRSGRAESLTEPDASIDLVWCRDVIEVLTDLPTALSELHRVLRPGGRLVAYTTVLGGPVDDAETAAIHRPLGNVVANLVQPDLEAAMITAGFRIEQRRTVGTRWREYLEERDQVVSRDLLRLARLRRHPEVIVGRYGPDAYRVAEASLQWSVHQFLGRFVPMIYVLTRPADEEPERVGS